MPRKAPKPSATPGSSDTPLPDPPKTFTDGLILPKLVVFDIDYTLWPFWVDTHVSGRPRPNDDNTAVTDSSGDRFAFYDDVPGILQHCRAKTGLQTALASRTHDPGLAKTMMGMLKFWPDGGTSEEFFDYKAVWPGDKREHFRRLHKQSGVQYEDMLFFDDESRNRNVEQLGVVMRLVRDGLTRDEFDKGVLDWRKRAGKGSEAAEEPDEDDSESFDTPF